MSAVIYSHRGIKITRAHSSDGALFYDLEIHIQGSRRAAEERRLSPVEFLEMLQAMGNEYVQQSGYIDVPPRRSH